MEMELDLSPVPTPLCSGRAGQIPCGEGVTGQSCLEHPPSNTWGGQPELMVSVNP